MEVGVLGRGGDTDDVFAAVLELMGTIGDAGLAV